MKTPNPSSGRPPASFACLRPPLMSNVGRRESTVPRSSSMLSMTLAPTRAIRRKQSWQHAITRGKLGVLPRPRLQCFKLASQDKRERLNMEIPQRFRCISSPASLAAVLALCLPLVTSCISIQWTTEEEANRQSEMLRRLTSDEEVEWDPTEMLKNLAKLRASIESNVQTRHSKILAKQALSIEDKKDLEQLLSGSLYYSRAAAEVKPVLELFSRSLSLSKEILPSTANTQTLLNQLARVSIVLSEDAEPKAFAFWDRTGSLPPRVIISVDLLRDFAKRNDDTKQLLEEIKSFEQEIIALPVRHGNKVVRRAISYTQRYMNLAMSGMTTQPARYEYVSSILFVVAHELAHAIYDPFNPIGHASEWTEMRADLFAIFVSEALTREAQTKNAADMDVLRGGFRTNNVDTITRLVSDAGFDVFLNVYERSNFSEGDVTHLPVKERKELLEPVYRAMFRRPLN